MTLTSDKILQTIKDEHLAPVPRWHFLFKSYAFWTFFAISLLLGSISFSVIIHVYQSGDFDILNHLQGNLLTSAVMLLPYFWLLSLALFAVSAYFNWKSTKLGYKFKRRWIVLGSVVLSCIFGSIFYRLGMGKQIDYLMTKSLPFYNQSKHAALKELWQQPENGLLTGKIVNIDEQNEEITLQDPDGKDWNVKDNSANWQSTKLEGTGKIVKVIGKKVDNSDFEAKEIRKCNNCQDDEENSSSTDSKKTKETSIGNQKSNPTAE